MAFSAISPFFDLTLEALVEIARGSLHIQPIEPDDLHPNAIRMRLSAAWVAEAMQSITKGDTPPVYYGINTGFGDNAGRAVFRRITDAEHLSRNLLLSHAIGVGDHLPEDVIRAALAIRINSLARGYSGVRPEVLNTLIEMLNRRVYPAVPCQGSLGASGDLAPLAHLILPLSAPLPDEDPAMPGATCHCYLNGKLVTGAEAMAAAGIPQIRLGAKEGVALINGTAISLAIGALALHDAYDILEVARSALVVSADALRAYRDAFLPHANRRRNRWQAEAASYILAGLEGSTLARGDADRDLPGTEGPPQDPYSLRCAPAVFGEVARTLDHVRTVIFEELDAVTDNPLIFAEPDPDSPDYLPRHTKVISGGNFHGEPLAFAMDFLGIALAELANISDRRMFTMLDPRLNRGLPAFLATEHPERAGLNSGLMIAQYTAAALVSENKSLAHPASVDSIPSSANREDHVSMSTIAARKAAQIVANVRQVIALELLCGTQALWFRLDQDADAKPGAGSLRVLEQVERLDIAPGQKYGRIRADVPPGPYVQALAQAIRDGRFTGLIRPSVRAQLK